MPKITLFIDGENFINKIEDVLEESKIVKNTLDLASIDFNKLFEKPLEKFNISRKIFYAARLSIHPETVKKSKALIKLQRKLRNSLINQGYKFVMSGHVRGQKVGDKVVFREKGVDVKIAVDLISLACDKELDTAILCSSDSDLQPVIKELRKRNVDVVYLGFELNPNKGLIYTTNRTILFRNSEILDAMKL